MADTQEKKVCPCCTKHTMRSEEERKKLINRLKRSGRTNSRDLSVCWRMMRTVTIS